MVPRTIHHIWIGPDPRAIRDLGGPGRRPMSVAYMSAEKFMYRFIAALRSQSTMEFKESLRSVDVLLIDDLQFLIGKDNTQEEFFHTFNALVDAGKQIIVSSDKPPSELAGIEDRLRTRLGQGMVADMPEWEAFEERMERIPADRRHLETHRGHLIEVTDLERPLVSADLIRNATGSGTRTEVRRNLDAIEAQGVKGVLYGPMGPDIPRELAAFAVTAGVAATV